MKLLSGLALLAFLVALPAQAQIITYVGFTNSNTMPGSPTDFTFFGNPDQFPPGTGAIVHNYTPPGGSTQPTILRDFEPLVGSDAQDTYGAQNNVASPYVSIYDPTSTYIPGSAPDATGSIYAKAQQPSTIETASDLVDFILAPSSSTFSYADFDVFVMISNTTNLKDADLIATVYDSTGAVPLFTLTQAVSDNLAPAGEATFEEFHITGAVAGDVLEFGATGATPGGSAYIGGISFKDPAAPEPTTYAMILSSLAFLGFILRRKAAAVNA